MSKELSREGTTMRVWILLVLSSTLSGCSPPGPRIDVRVHGNDLVFFATSSAWPRFLNRRAVRLQPDLIRVDHGGKVVWRIERKRDRRCLDYGAGDPSPVFPLTYGKVPECFIEVVRPQHLIAGKAYRIATVGEDRGDNGIGFFRTGVTADNLDSVPYGVSNWGDVEST